MPADRIELRGLRAFGRHGVFDAERTLGQEFVVDVTLHLDLHAAAAGDDLTRTVNYGEVAQDAAAVVAGEPAALIETVAERIAAECLARPLVERVQVAVHKPAAPIPLPFDDVVVRVERSRVRRAVVALGANLGDRRAALQGAAYALAALPGTVLRAVSPVYETVALVLPGTGPQPDYLNAVVLADTSLAPDALLAQAQRVEAAFGRERSERWGARTLDVDIVSVEGVVSDRPELTLPHPRAAERAFVLAPWAAADPSAQLPGHGPVSALLHALADEERAGVRRRDDLALVLP
ncbi:2-amino-4-hydroxy-6-hydroxymethyldihydropteridine diphosphokinase [Motilibacter aurantiacus]|uniref:2-amino-4-hydroxy-6- hydroxymethyldihydropteridine diphosphokinase n=1 Tax=Motilibacter aurantiacus TaxID=2714955 RepID=UPI00140E5EA3|nr:2-amino-4-hydroxy-6-hydroxymethyldihydropteridine diphosphokinase [Motilibacter aurantiacus]NHC44277.1 2-amino-4-hydroxy-6-hydroxymethyldihydropteridine diphosphokinase [Motilibacter aurantiacus]